MFPRMVMSVSSVALSFVSVAVSMRVEGDATHVDSAPARSRGAVSASFGLRKNSIMIAGDLATVAKIGQVPRIGALADVQGREYCLR